MGNQLNTRIAHKYDTASEWQKVEKTFIPLRGELVVSETENAAPKIKIGDGSKTLINLKEIGTNEEEVKDIIKETSFVSGMRNSPLGINQYKVGDIMTVQSITTNDEGEITSITLGNSLTQATPITVSDITTLKTDVTTLKTSVASKEPKIIRGGYANISGIKSACKATFWYEISELPRSSASSSANIYTARFYGYVIPGQDVSYTSNEYYKTYEDKDQKISIPLLFDDSSNILSKYTLESAIGTCYPVHATAQGETHAYGTGVISEVIKSGSDTFCGVLIHFNEESGALGTTASYIDADAHIKFDITAHLKKKS